jgi:glycosyltransferase involved in cell wall biosynthesis
MPYLEEALRSALGQSLRELQVFVSDNCSSDGTDALLQRFASADSRLAIARQRDAVTMAENGNACLERVQTEYFMLLCHDDYLASASALAQACEVLDAQPDVNAVFCDLLYVNSRGKCVARRTFGRSGRFDAMSVGRASILAARNLFGIPLLVRARAVQGLRYDGSLPYTADVDMAIACAAGGSLFHIAEPLIANRFHPRNATWGLLTDVSQQMERIAAKRSIPLSRLDRIRARASAYAVAIAKRLFLAYVGIRS